MRRVHARKKQLKRVNYFSVKWDYFKDYELRWWFHLILALTDVHVHKKQPTNGGVVPT